MLLLALGLAACGGGGGSAPAALPPLSVAPSATPSGVDKPEADPSALTPPPPGSTKRAAVNDPEVERRKAAEAAAKQWVDVLNTAYTTSDPAALEALSLPQCHTCSAYAASLRDAQRTNRRWVGGLQHVNNAVAAPVMNDETDVLVNYDTSPFYVLEANGTRSNALEARHNETMQVSLREVDGRWLAVEVVQL